ncbi:MAG: nitroreductase family protein [Clostridia bacterium]|nr:nitroreductase family protein [Clostridia bacterium]
MDACAINGFFSPTQRERYLSAVSGRRSVRTYLGDPGVEALSALSYTAARVALPGVRLALGDAQDAELYRHLPFVDPIRGTRKYAAVIVDDAVPNALIHAGVSGEAFVLEAAALGLGTCWVAAFKRGGVNVPLEEGEKIRAVIAFGIPGESGGSRKRKRLSEICSPDPTDWPLWAYNAAECVRVAPSAVNLQPWRLTYAGRTLSLSSARSGAGLDIGIALLHLSLGVGDKPHHIRWGEGREIAALIVEDGIK